MRVVLSTPAYFPRSFGGGEVYVRHLARELARRGHAPTVLTGFPWTRGDSPYEVRRYEHDGIPVVALGVNPATVDHAELYTGDGVHTRAALKEILGGIRPDLVHVNGLKPAMTAVCRDQGYHHVVTVHHAGVACASGTLVRPDGTPCPHPMSAGVCVPCVNASRRPGWKAGRLLGAIPRWLYEPIGRRLNARHSLSLAERGLIYPWLVEQSILAKRSVLDQAEVVIAPSQAMKSLLLKNGRKEDIVVVPHGIEPLRKTALRPFEGRPFRLGYVGRIDPLKGLHVIVEALEKLSTGRDCQLHVFGAARNARDEAYRLRIAQRYRGRGQVVFHGLVGHNELSRVYGSIDLLVVPSLLPEAFGLVVLEAFSAGRPVVVSSMGALPELVRDGIDGIVLSRAEPEELARVIQRMLDNPDLIAEMAWNVPPVRTIQEHVDDLLRAYDRALAGANALAGT